MDLRFKKKGFFSEHSFDEHHLTGLENFLQGSCFNKIQCIYVYYLTV